MMRHLSTKEIEGGLERVRAAPKDAGIVELLACRPGIGEREQPEEVLIDLLQGVVGDNWRERGSRSTPDSSANPECQVTIMNARMTALVCDGDTTRFALAGDQIYADLDLSMENLPPGSLIRVGEAVLQISATPHTGCAKFMERFGKEALRVVNSPVGRQLRLRGMNTRVVSGGRVRLGDVITKEPTGDS